MAPLLQTSTLDEYGYPLRPNTRRQLRDRAVRTSKRILRISITTLLSIIGAFLWLRRFGRRYPPLHPQSFSPRRILVIRLDLIGDLVLSLTVVHLLKRTYPDAEIDLLALPSSAKIATSEPDLSEIISYDPNIWRRPQALLRPKNWQALRALRKRLHDRQYDLAVSVFGNWAAVLAVLSGARRRVGFAGEGFPGFMTDSVPGRHWDDPRAPLHEVDYCLQLAQAAGASISPEDRIPHLATDLQAYQEIEQLLRQEGIQPGKRLIACHVSSNNGQSKRWPIPYWATLIDRLIHEDGNSVVLTGAQNDLPLIELILRRTHEHPVNLAGKTSLTQLAALLQRADLLVTGDSGPMHIAAAVGTPLIAIHGPTNPAHSGPLSPKATILRSDIWCSPCYDAKSPADCRFFTTQCMKNIAPDQVLTVIHEKLQDRQVVRQEAID
ncbi:MAG: lipopolysaccharide heptosyltransferase II [Ktedonobacteraceae bacterium]|nr:lipopolysaccharide heptosyltransferase II [Ktedonobacteraceae bacterium]